MSANALLTPPISDKDAEAMLGGHKTSAQSGSASTVTAGQGPTVYQQLFPTLANLAVQSDLQDLVRTAEGGDIEVEPESNFDETRLLLVAPLVLAYINLDDTPPARIALSRLPDHLQSHPLTGALLRLIAATRYRNYATVYKSAEELVGVVQASGFFDPSLAAIIKLLIDRFIETFRQRTVVLLAKAYTSITVEQTQVYLGLPAELVLSVALGSGWSYDAANQVLTPSAARLRGNPVPLNRGKGSSLSTFGAVVGSASQLENTV